MENYQACSKIAALDGNILAAFNYQLKMLHKLSLQSSANSITETIHESLSTIKITRNTDTIKDSISTHNIRKNTELFNKQAEKNLMESLEDSVAKNWAKIPTSRSLNNLQTLAQELYTFDCQGGLEGLCKNQRNEDLPSANVNADYSDVKSNANEENEQQEWIDNLVFNENDSLPQHKNVAHSSAQNLTRLICTGIMSNINNNQTDTYKEKNVLSDKTSSRSQRNYVINETIKTLKFYLSNIDNETNISKCELLKSAIDFWIEHNLPVQSLENIFLEYIHIIYYPLGLLLFW